MFKRKNCDRKSQLSGILTEPRALGLLNRPVIVNNLCMEIKQKIIFSSIIKRRTANCTCHLNYKGLLENTSCIKSL